MTPTRAFRSLRWTLFTLVVGLMGLTHTAAPSHIVPRATTTMVQLKDILRFTNNALTECQLNWQSVDVATDSSDGQFSFSLYAVYSDGSQTVPISFRTSLDHPADQTALRILDLIPNTYFISCVRKVGTDPALGEEQRHLDDMVPALNARLDGCTLRQVGAVGPSDAEGYFRFYLDARYPDGSTDRQIQLETNTNNTIARDVSDFLDLIPSQIFRRCRHRGDDPDAAALQRHLDAVLVGLGTHLTQCTITQDGALGALDASGSADYWLVSANADGMHDDRQRFRTALNQQVEAEVSALLTSIPSVYFQKCQVQGGTDPTALRQHIRDIIARVNSELESCTVVQDGDLGTIGADGFADFYLNAEYADGSRDMRKLFRTALSEATETKAQGLLELIPSQMFHGCSTRGGGDNPARAAAQQHVVDTLALLNPDLNGCIVALTDTVGIPDDHGDFNFYLQSFVQSTGRFTDPARFHANMHLPAASEESTLLALIPSVEFAECRHRD